MCVPPADNSGRPPTAWQALGDTLAIASTGKQATAPQQPTTPAAPSAPSAGMRDLRGNNGLDLTIPSRPSGGTGINIPQ